MTSLRFSALAPKWSRIYRNRELTPDHGGFPTDQWSLQFTCPDCGPPYQVAITIGPTMVQDRVWQASPMPDGPNWPDRVTIVPSIDYTSAGHGRKHPTCPFHAKIINGEIVR